MRTLLFLDRWLPSWVVLLSSIWATWVLLSPPSNFAAFPVAFRYTAWMSEVEWAIVLLISLSLHGIGLWLRTRKADIAAARLIGFIGLSGQTVFWLYFGASTILANPDTLFGFTGMMVGVTGAWRLCRYGWAPDV